MSTPTDAEAYATAEHRAVRRMQFWAISALIARLAFDAPAALRGPAMLAVLVASGLVVASFVGAIHRLRADLGHPDARWWKAPASRTAAVLAMLALGFVGMTLVAVRGGLWIPAGIGACFSATLCVATPYFELLHRLRRRATSA